MPNIYLLMQHKNNRDTEAFRRTEESVRIEKAANKRRCVIFVLRGSIIKHCFGGPWSHDMAFCSNFHENMNVKQECPEIP